MKKFEFRMKKDELQADSQFFIRNSSFFIRL